MSRRKLLHDIRGYSVLLGDVNPYEKAASAGITMSYGRNKMASTSGFEPQFRDTGHELAAAETNLRHIFWAKSPHSQRDRLRPRQ